MILLRLNWNNSSIPLRAATELLSNNLSENLIATVFLDVGSHSMHWWDDLFQ